MIEQAMQSVLQNWVMRLPLREQGVLLTGVRGCDLVPKDPHRLDSVERHLVAFLRWCFLNPADPREVDYTPGCWFRSQPPQHFRSSSLGHYPMHWISHVMHGFQVVAYRHPDIGVADQALRIYQEFCRGLHLPPEGRTEMIDRLSDDRIANGTVVS